ncbi:MAG: hypothetical protein IJZ82_05315 [Lachnospiraceae bacterium]|nr:hypothetical protein [Lachnospiraceae bacterium]
MSEVRSALVWERGDVFPSPLTVTLQEVMVQKKQLLLALVCQGEAGGQSAQLAAGYLGESIVGWFYNELVQYCNAKPECSVTELEQLLRGQWERARKEWQEYAGKRNCEAAVGISGILIWGSGFVAMGNEPVYVFNRRFNKPRRKNLLPAGEDVIFASGEIGSFLSLYLENKGMSEGIKEEALLESLYVEKAMEEHKLEKRLGELGKAAVSRMDGKSVGAVILEVEP